MHPACLDFSLEDIYHLRGSVMIHSVEKVERAAIGKAQARIRFSSTVDTPTGLKAPV